MQVRGWSPGVLQRARLSLAMTGCHLIKGEEAAPNLAPSRLGGRSWGVARKRICPLIHSPFRAYPANRLWHPARSLRASKCLPWARLPHTLIVG